MEQLILHFSGKTPLLMHAPRSVNVLDPQTREMKKLTGKRKKTEDDLYSISRIEWELGLYYEPEVGVHIPGSNVLTCLRDAGKVTKQGTDVTRAVFPTVPLLSLGYDGPKPNGSLQPLWDAGLKDVRRVGNQRNSIMRCRPMFPTWELTVPLAIESSIIDCEAVVDIAEKAGVMIGLGDGRVKGFGRFDVEVVN